MEVRACYPWKVTMCQPQQETLWRGEQRRGTAPAPYSHLHQLSTCTSHSLSLDTALSSLHDQTPHCCPTPPTAFHQHLPMCSSGRAGSPGISLSASFSGFHPMHPRLHLLVCRLQCWEAAFFGQILGFAKPVPPSDVHSAARGTASQFIILLDSHTAPAQLEPRVLAINMLCPD